MASILIAGNVTLMDVWTFGIIHVIVNWLNWKVIYWISLMPQLIALKFFYDSVEMDFDWLSRWHIVKAYTRVLPRMNVYQAIRLHTWMSILYSSIKEWLSLEMKGSWRADYITRVLPSPGNVTCSRAFTLFPSLGGDPLGCIFPYQGRKEWKQSNNHST